MHCFFQARGDWERRAVIVLTKHSITFDCYINRLSLLAWKIPWTEEPGRLQSMGSLRVGHDSVTSLSLFTFMHWRRKWQPTPVFLPGESQGWRAWWAAVYGVTQSQTRLRWFSSSSWTFFGIAFLWNWNENWPFPVLWLLQSLQNLLAYWVQHFCSIIF